MILISMLGIGKYEPTTYQFEGKQAESSKYIVKAISQILPIETIFVVMTEQAKLAHSEALKSVCDFEIIDIPTGKNEQEFWGIFQAIVDKIPKNSSIIIDVTHGFRSQPMLLLAIAVYLKVLKNVLVEYILYGAFDAKDENGVSPIFNLKPFLDLISWSFATESFLQKGDATLISELIIGIHKKAYKTKSEYLPKGLESVGNRLLKLTKSFSVVRPQEALNLLKNLPQEISKSYTDSENLASAKPFKELINKIIDRFAPLIDEGNAIDVFSEKGLKSQGNIIKFYLETKQYQQAITLSREVLVTFICELQKLNKIEGRAKAESILHNLFELSKETDTFITDEAKKYARLWQNLANLRNDVNHAGMRISPIPAESLIPLVEEYCQEVIDIIEKN